MISKYTLLVAATAFLSASHVAAFSATNDGCYTSTTGLTLNSTNTFNSAGKCSEQCLPLGMAVMATQDSSCYCGATLPPASDSTDNSTCSVTCPGYPSDLCGGSSAYSVYLTGLTYSVKNYDDSDADTTTSSSAAKATGKSTGTTSASASVVTVGGQTVVVTAASSATGTSSADKNSSSSSSSGPSKAGIAAGVVIGIVAIAAIAGGLFVFLRNRKRREIEEEYRKNATVNNFIAGGKPPNSSGGASSFNDMRLDPAVMAQRRMSDGSIADNQDYSRRILKVTNA